MANAASLARHGGRGKGGGATGTVPTAEGGGGKLLPPCFIVICTHCTGSAWSASLLRSKPCTLGKTTPHPGRLQGEGRVLSCSLLTRGGQASRAHHQRWSVHAVNVGLTVKESGKGLLGSAIE